MGSNKKQKANKKEPDFSVLNLILKHHIIFWLLIFPPVAIYKLLKHKIVNKTVGAILIGLFIALLFFFTYLAINPTVTIDTSVSDKMEEMGFGTIREVEFLGKYQKFYTSEVITTTGFYTVYYEVSEDNDIEVNTIVELKTEMNENLSYNDFSIVYQGENPDLLLGKINPAAIKFLIQNNDYGEIQSIKSSDIGNQIFETTKGTYKFNYQYYETTNVKRYIEENVWEDVMNRDYVIKMKPEFEKALSKKRIVPLYYQIDQIITYGITEDTIYYVFANFCGNLYQITKYNDGKIVLEYAAEYNPVSQDDLAAVWEAYQNAHNHE